MIIKMISKNNIGLSVFLSLFAGIFVVMPFISSCGKSTVSPSTLNVQYQVINLSPNLGPVDLYIDFKIYNKSSFIYPSASGYFYLSSIDTPFQIRPSQTLTQTQTVISTGNIFNMDDILKPNFKYTLFLTGLTGDSSVTRVLTVDTANLPTVGSGKLRFINLSPRSSGLDVVINGTASIPFTNVQYLKQTPFVQLPAGTYDFQIFLTGSTSIVQDHPNVVIQDGRAYTLYAYGLVGHTTDSLAFGAGVVTNR